MKKLKAFTEVKGPKEALTEVKVSMETLPSVEKVFVASSDFVRF